MLTVALVEDSLADPFVSHLEGKNSTPSNFSLLLVHNVKEPSPNGERILLRAKT